MSGPTTAANASHRSGARSVDNGRTSSHVGDPMPSRLASSVRRYHRLREPGGVENVAWGSATLRAAVMLGGSFLLCAYVPDRLFTYLAVRTTPTIRDLLVSLSWLLALVLAF